MRPVGVVERIRAAQQADRAWHEARPRLALVHAVQRFISLSGLLWFHDHPVEKTLDALDDVQAAHRATVSFEPSTGAGRRCLALAVQLTERIPSTRTPDELDEAWELLVTLPPRVLLHREDVDAHADLTLLNEAWWLAEGSSTPYRAAGSIAALGYWRPDDRWGLATAMADLRVRFEDDPAERPTIEQAVTDRLARFLVEYDDWWREAGS